MKKIAITFALVCALQLTACADERQDTPKEAAKPAGGGDMDNREDREQ